MTKQRQLIAQLVSSRGEHLTAEEVFLRAKAEMPSISMGTVYRNLNQMAEEGTIRRLSFGGAPDRFDSDPCLHGHLLCATCGKITDVALNNLLEKLQQTLGEQILSYVLTARHICADCRAAGDQEII